MEFTGDRRRSGIVQRDAAIHGFHEGWPEREENGAVGRRHGVEWDVEGDS